MTDPSHSLDRDTVQVSICACSALELPISSVQSRHVRQSDQAELNFGTSDAAGHHLMAEMFSTSRVSGLSPFVQSSWRHSPVSGWHIEMMFHVWGRHLATRSIGQAPRRWA